MTRKIKKTKPILNKNRIVEINSEELSKMDGKISFRKLFNNLKRLFKIKKNEKNK